MFKILIIMIFSYFIFEIIIRYLININLLHPKRISDNFKYEHSKNDINEVTITVQKKPKVTLFCYHKKNPGTKKYLLFFGGNASYMVQNSELINDLSKNYSVFVPDYRGYGKSTGNPNYNNIVSDGILVFNYLITNLNINHEDIAVGGMSLGGAVASQVVYNISKKYLINSLILINTFSSLFDAVISIKNNIPIVKNIPELIIKLLTYNIFNTSEYLKHICKKNIKITILHNKYDEMFSVSHPMKNYNVIKHNEQNKLHISDVGGHNTVPNMELLA